MNQYSKDPYYSSAYDVYKSDEIIKQAGYIKNTVKPASTFTNGKLFISTPFQKIVDIHQSYTTLKSKKRCAVIVSTGGFSPIHEGHISMMEEARKYLERNEVFVLGGYFSPSHDAYAKYANKQSILLPSSSRIRLSQLAVEQSDWLMVDPWESRYNSGVLNFTDVLIHIEEYLKTILDGSDIEVFYCFGSDNAPFARAFVSLGSCICVERKGYEKEYKAIQDDMHLKRNPNCHFIQSGYTIEMSSTLIRVQNHADVSVQRKMQMPKQYYFLRDDASYATSMWKDVNSALLQEFSKKVSALLYKSLDPHVKIEMQSVYVKTQQKIVDALVKKTDVINIDTCTSGGTPLAISRLFSLSDAQCVSRNIVERPGNSTLSEQFENIPPGAYTLVDDDILPGSQYDKAVHAIPIHIRIKKTVSLLEESIKGKPVYDCLDIRDFIVGSRDGGLVVRLPNGQLARAPYMLPYVSLVSRAKIIPSQERDLSISFWKLNKWFYDNLDQTIYLADVNPSFINLMVFVGFDLNMTLKEICEWHATLFEVG